MELRLHRDGTRWDVDWTMTLDDRNSAATATIRDFRLEDGRFEFSVTGVEMLRGPATFRGTLSDGALRGMAELGQPGSMMRAIGSWTLERMTDTSE